ncbi:MAG: hypothetical protein HN350_22285 [Phycisphaerales bacterium]|jgi:hypothetical protein|nr:hypothetical protein [Phycisphaerales bacterium]
MAQARPVTSRSGHKLYRPLTCLIALLAFHGCQVQKEKPPQQPETKAPPIAAIRPVRRKTQPPQYTPEPIAISGSGSVEFDINWPLGRLRRRSRSRRNLLTGQLLVASDISQPGDPKITVGLIITRTHAKNADRKYWNTMTEFKQYQSWMPYVRGRDASKQEWLWPNLAYLFKIHGYDRLERYGGWDRGHRNDNDFGGVLIRKLTAGDDAEPPGPLVSADWHAAGTKDAGRFDVVHSARSDTFTLHPSGDNGSVRLWFIYGDFMDWSPPWKYATGPMKNRPLQKEYDGGIIAQFRIDWTRAPAGPFEFKVTQETPNVDTGFNWRKWIARRAAWDTPKAPPTLTDR